MKKAGLPKLIRNMSGVALTQIADEVLMHQAKVLTEGAVEKGVGGKDIYAGSTMITIDLGPFRSQFSEENWKQVLLGHLRNSIYFRLSVMRMARREAELRCEKGLLGELRTELEFTIEQELLLVDIDVLGILEQAHLEDASSGETR